MLGAVCAVAALIGPPAFCGIVREGSAEKLVVRSGSVERTIFTDAGPNAELIQWFDKSPDDRHFLVAQYRKGVFVCDDHGRRIAGPLELGRFYPNYVIWKNNHEIRGLAVWAEFNEKANSVDSTWIAFQWSLGAKRPSTLGEHWNSWVLKKRYLEDTYDQLQALPTDERSALSWELNMGNQAGFLAAFPKQRTTFYLRRGSLLRYDWRTQEVSTVLQSNVVRPMFVRKLDDERLSVTNISNWNPMFKRPTRSFTDAHEDPPTESYDTLIISARDGSMVRVPGMTCAIPLSSGLHG